MGWRGKPNEFHPFLSASSVESLVFDLMTRQVCVCVLLASLY